MGDKGNFKYSDEEIISLAELNPGYGLRRLINQLYPNVHKFSEYKYEFIMLFNDYNEFCGIDLIEQLEDQSYSKLVSGPEYLEITGEKQLPVGYGRGTGGRKSKPDRKNPTASLIKVPLPPQEFNWGGLPPESERSRTR